MLFENFDKKIKEAADQHHPAYDEKAWQKMEKLLDQHLPRHKDDRRRILFALLLLLLIGGGTFVTISKPWTKRPTSDQSGRENKTAQSSIIQPSEKSNNILSITQDNKTNGATASKENLVKNSKNGINVRSNIADKSLNINNSQTIISNNVQSRKEELTSKGNSPVTNESNQHKNVPSAEVVKKNDQEPISQGLDRQSSSDINSVEKNDNKNKINNNPVAGNEAKTNTDQPISKPEAKKATPHKNVVGSKNGFSLFVSGGPDVSKAGTSKTGRATLAYGAGLAYTKNRFTLSAGVFAAKKIYWAGSKDYKLSFTPPSSSKFEGANANCDVLEIPVKLGYAFDLKDKGNWFASAGLSSYVMKKEKYVYSYESTWGQYYFPYEAKYENRHYFSVLNLSAGYKKQLSNTLSISAEPYIEIPLTGIGIGKVHLNSGGILFTIGVKPFKK